MTARRKTVGESVRNSKLADAWVVLQQHWWAYGQLVRVCEFHPRRAWSILMLLATRAKTKELVEDLGAGPLQDFVRHHGPAFVGRLEQQAIANPRFRKALRHVDLPQATDPVSQRLIALGCRPIPGVRLASWQSRA
jgi:hypothetical protein